MFPKRELEALLFQGDVIRASSQEDGLQLSNLFEGEVVRQSVTADGCPARYPSVSGKRAGFSKSSTHCASALGAGLPG